MTANACYLTCIAKHTFWLGGVHALACPKRNNNSNVLLAHNKRFVALMCKSSQASHGIQTSHGMHKLRTCCNKLLTKHHQTRYILSHTQNAGDGNRLTSQAASGPKDGTPSPRIKTKQQRLWYITLLLPLNSQLGCL